MGQKVTLWRLGAITYLMVAGGPFGVEELVPRMGFGWAILLLAVVPFVWSFPTALLVGELSTSLPHEGGYCAWVFRALGPFWGFQEAWTSFAASVFDLAIYPTIFVDALTKLFPAMLPHGVFLKALCLALALLLNLRGSRSVGTASLALGLLVLAPFVVACALAFLHLAGPSYANPVGNVEPLSGLAIAMWNTMGWDNASTIAAEVENPQRTYPRALLVTVGIVIASYVLPLGLAWFTGSDPSGWTSGAWVSWAMSLGGPVLALIVLGSAALGAFGAYSALLLSYAQVPAFLAKRSLLPPWLGHRSQSGSPWPALIACTVLWGSALGLSLPRLVAIDMLLYGASLVLEFAALIVLRRREPALHRPFLAAKTTAGLAIVAAGPVACLALVLYGVRGERIGGYSAIGFSSAVIAIGPLAYFILKARYRRPDVELS